MKKLIAAAALSLPLFTAGLAAAGEPMELTDDQMDGVTAGASAAAIAAAAGVGNIVFTGAQTLAKVAVVDTFASEVTTINLMKSKSLAGAEVSAQ